jgi:hypothetical protein
MRILIGFSYYPYPVDVSFTLTNWANRLKAAGFDIELFPLTINPPAVPYWWKQLDRCWKLGDKELLKLYENLARKAEEFDVFLNWNGINIHPEFLPNLSTYNIYACFDDPESSEILSKPVASAYDLCMIGNIAEVDTYKSWGVKEVRFWPLGFMANDFDPSLTEEQILYGMRENDITLLCERKYVPDRIKRLDQFASAFPNGNYYGAGWPSGFLKDESRIPLYLNTKIGPNFHNSTGPINFRTYTLPACGVMQICDNKTHLGKIFEIDKEVVGFDTVEEAIEKTRYYLANDEERRRIAAAGWKKSTKEYNEVAVFSLVEKYVKELNPNLQLRKKAGNVERILGLHRLSSFPNRVHYIFKNKFIGPEQHL